MAESGDRVLLNGDDYPAVSNGFPLEKPSQALTESDVPIDVSDDGSDDEKLMTPKGSDESDGAIGALHAEIQRLAREKSELQRRTEEMLAEMEQSEVRIQALASHASYLEGELVRSQEDLVAASAAAEDFEADSKSLRAKVQVLKADLASAMASKADLEARIGGLEADLAVEKEKKEAVIADLKKEMAALKEEGKKVGDEKMELEKVRLGLEGRIEGLLSQIEKEATVQKSRDLEVATKEKSRVSFTVAAAAAAGTGAVAVVVTVLLLKRQR